MPQRMLQRYCAMRPDAVHRRGRQAGLCERTSRPRYERGKRELPLPAGQREDMYPAVRSGLRSDERSQLYRGSPERGDHVRGCVVRGTTDTGPRLDERLQHDRADLWAELLGDMRPRLDGWETGSHVRVPRTRTVASGCTWRSLEQRFQLHWYVPFSAAGFFKL